MPTNNPQPQTSGSRSGSEQSSSFEGRVERGSERVERGIEQLATSAADRVREAREQATSGITEQRDMVAQRIRRISGVLRAGSSTLATDDSFAQNLLEAASDRIARVADYVSEATPGMVSDDLQRVARRRPGLFFGGAFMLGLTLGRFVKSSTKPRAQTEFDVEIEDDLDRDAGRLERPYPGRPMISSSPTSDAAAPGSGATSSSIGSSPIGSTSETRSYGSGPSASSSSSVPGQGARPGASSLSGSAGGGGTLPPPPYAGGAASSSTSSTPARTPSSSPGGGSTSNAGTKDPLETSRGQGAKS